MDIPPAGSTLGAGRIASDRMVTCRYAGKDQEVMDFLVAQGSTQVEIPQSVLTAHGGGLYIESMIHSKIAKQQADIEQETTERAVLEARTAQQKAASVAAEQAAAEEKEQERQRLRAEWELELKNKIGSMELQMQMLLRRLRKKQGLQLLQKIFNQCNRNREKYQTRSWKVQLVAGARLVSAVVVVAVVRRVVDNSVR